MRRKKEKVHLSERRPFTKTIQSNLIAGVLARVVLIDFPHPGIKAIGLVMRNFRDSATGEQLAAVFVPTTPNPTSGYLAILPVQRLVPTSMSMDQAMTMIVSGGTVAPEEFSTSPAVL